MVKWEFGVIRERTIWRFSMKVLAKSGDGRKLTDLVSVGPAIAADFAKLGVTSVRQLAREEPGRLYERLCRLTGVQQDPCVLDVFCAAVAQARDAKLPRAQRNWWYWSRKRKAAAGRSAKAAGK
jgi:hypothetical protein